MSVSGQITSVGTGSPVPGQPPTEDRIRFAIEGAGIGTWHWDIPRDTLAWSARTCEIFGVGPETIVTQETVLLLIHPQDRERVREAVYHAVATVGEYRAEFRIVRPDGDERHVMARGRASGDASGKAVTLEGIVLDVTDQKQVIERVAAQQQIENRLRETEQHVRLLETLFDQIPIGVTVAEPPDVRIRKISRYGETVSGRPNIDLEGHFQRELIWSVYHTDGITYAAHDELPLTRATLRGEVVRDEEWLLIHPESGKRTYILCNASPVIDEQGQITAGILVWSDITALKEAQEEIVRLNGRLHRAVYESSHRLKNQLQTLQATVSLELLAAQDERVPADALRRLESQIHTLSIVHDLLTYQARTDGTVASISVRQLLERVLITLQQMAPGQQLDFSIDDATVSIKVGSSLTLVLNEAVSNAIKHGNGRVVVSFRLDDGCGVLEVQDNGQGFPDAFDPQVAANTGLDLINSLVVLDLGGSVHFDNRIENEQIAGGRVTVRFPVQG